MLGYMVSQEEIRHVAALARIRLTEDELTRFQKTFETILDFVGKLQEMDVGNTAATIDASGLVNTMRRDGIPETEAVWCDPVKLLAQAPASQKQYVAVKSVFESGS